VATFLAKYIGRCQENIKFTCPFTNFFFQSNFQLYNSQRRNSLNSDSTIDPKKSPHGTIEFLLRRIRHKGDLPAFSKHIVEINKKLSSLHSINFSSAGELSGIILKDLSITNKLLKVVNSSYYGALSGSVTTISRAVFLLGAEKVRLAAASLMILDHLQNKGQTDELKDAALSSFLSAVIARDVADKMMFASKEEVFICALLHNLGKHLVVCYFPEEYQAIKNLTSQEIDEQRASKSVLGVSFSELGMGVTGSWGFPSSIIDSMDVIDGSFDSAPDSEASVLKSIANYATDLCTVAEEPDSAKRMEKLKVISEKYQYSVSFPAGRSLTFIEDAAAKIDLYTDVLKITPSRSPLLRRLLALHEEKTARLSSSGERSGEQAQEGKTTTPKKLSPEEERADILKNCMLEINEMLNSASNISDAIYTIMETMYRGFEFNRVLFCMADAGQFKMAARFGFGENIDTILANFSFKISRSSDYFNIAVMRLRDVAVDDGHTPGVRENLPGWYLKMITARSFLIYPLSIKDKCIGLLYADKKTPTILMNQNERDYMNILRDKAVWALLHKH